MDKRNIDQIVVAPSDAGQRLDLFLATKIDRFSRARIQALIRRGELETMRQAIEEGTNEGLQSFDQALFSLIQRKTVGTDDALRFADSPNNLRLRMKGIR